MATLTFKKGATLQVTITVTDSAGLAVDLSGHTNTSDLKSDKTGVSTGLTLDETSAATGVIIASVETSSLALGDYSMDLKYVLAGVTKYTSTQAIEIVAAITA